jgi:alkyl sulfatase BDS1-like metallo-beta-lactamase superfamily hydrolase
VADRVYQVRGADLANMNIIEGDTGLIIIDTLAHGGNRPPRSTFITRTVRANPC